MLVWELVTVAEAHVQGQSWTACGMLHTAKGHQGGSHVVELAVVAVVAVLLVTVAVDVVVVNVAVAQEHGQMWTRGTLCQKGAG